MTTDADAPPQADPPAVELKLPSRGAAKRPEQLAALLESTLRREFPGGGGADRGGLPADGATVAVRNLDQVDDRTARKLARRARGVYNEFLISPWY